VLAFPGHEAYLEVTSRLLAAMMELRARPEFDVARVSIASALLAAQGDDGRLEIVLDVKRDDRPDDATAAGLGLQALASYGLWQPDKRIEPAIGRARKFYEAWYRRSPDPMGSAEIAHALSLAYAITKDARISDLAFEMLDALASKQLSAENCPWPELHGAVNIRAPGLVGIDTATYLRALAVGLDLAAQIGDRPRLERYRKAVQAASRFVLQLEMRQAGCYYVRSRIDAMGGIRTAPWNNTLRADHCAEAIMSLMCARTALFGRRG
jgi:hypothetical protein